MFAAVVAAASQLARIFASSANKPQTSELPSLELIARVCIGFVCTAGASGV
jgi:hypothetical protein